MILTVAALRTELLFVGGPKAAVGVGARSRSGLVRVVERWRPRGVAVVGYCGGLRADLPPGAVVLADRVKGPAGTVRVGARVLVRARDLLPGAEVGPMVTVARPASPAEKVALGAEVLGVDLESAHLAEELFRRGIPFLVARVVLDSLWEEVPQGLRAARWAGRALRCSWTLGRIAPLLARALREAG